MNHFALPGGNRLRISLFLLSALLCAAGLPAAAQKTTVLQPPAGNPPRATVIAGPEYKAGGLRRTFLGRHYRTEWTTPVSVPVLNLDTLGGLLPYQQGGGRQSRTLRLRNAAGHEYVLRSVDKDYGAALPPIARGTFIERLAKDQVSTGHPYAALTVAGMAEAAGIYHTNPTIVLVPDDPRLGEYRAAFGGLLCLFEERPDENAEHVASFGRAKNIVSTAKMQEHVWSDSRYRIDKEAFVRARLFDMFVGDWGRHEDQWRWARFDSGDLVLYRPVPRDRDQTYALFDGIVPYIASSPEPLEHLKSFKGDIKNLKKYNFPARHLDRQVANEVPLATWVALARDLQARLTDSVIEASVRLLPPEVFPISGPALIEKLKSRRGHLEEWAHKYYGFISKQVDVTGTRGAELFEVTRGAGGDTRVQVFALDAAGKPAGKPFFSRNFQRNETHELHLYGLEGADIFRIDGKDSKGMRVRVIGSAQPDSIIDNSVVAGSSDKTVAYDNTNDYIHRSVETRVHLSPDTAINRYNYRSFRANEGSLIKFPSYSNQRGVYFNVGYRYTRYRFRKEPFGWEQRLRFNYSVSNKSFGGDYYGVYNELIGKISVLVDARFDQVLQHYYYGIGNNTKAFFDPAFYQLLTREGAVSLGLNRRFGAHHGLTALFGFQSIRVLDNRDHFVSAVERVGDSAGSGNFGSVGLSYLYHAVNNEVLPTKGFNFAAAAQHFRNLRQSGRSFERYDAAATAYLPFSKVISLVLRAGGSTVQGTPEFYQLPTLGGGASLRGYRRERFYGETMAFNQNELRFLWDWRSFLFNGKVGFMALLDNGRVWHRSTSEGGWHTGFGGGLILVPFNRIAITVGYAVSDEDQRINLRLGSRAF